MCSRGHRGDGGEGRSLLLLPTFKELCHRHKTENCPFAGIVALVTVLTFP